MTKKAISLGLLVIMLFSMTGCFGNGNIESTTGDEDMFFSKKAATATYSMTDDAVVNPFMGFAVDATSKKAASQYSLVYIDITFRELQPDGPDSFDFDRIAEENNIDLWRSEGKHAVLRFVCDKPGADAHTDIPDWLYELTGDGVAYDTSYGKGYSPEYNNPVFIEYHAKAIKAIGEYFSDGFVSYIELGSLGHWGEWHVKYEDGLPRIPVASVRQQYIEPYIVAFPDAEILMRRPFAAAKKYGFGVYNDMAGHPDATAEWLDWIENGGDYSQADEDNALIPMKNFWKIAPSGGELTSSFSMDYLCKTDLEQTISLLRDSHTTFIGPKCPVSSSDKYDDELYREAVDEMIRNVGYRIGITEMTVSKTNSDGVARVDLKWKNNGVAPLYFNLPVKLYITDETGYTVSETDVNIGLSSLEPGDTLTTSTKVQLGTEHSGMTVYIGIIDPMTNIPSVQLVSDQKFTSDGLNLMYSFK